MHDDSSFLQALMQSSMLESAKINERGKGSFFLYPNTAKLTKVTNKQHKNLIFFSSVNQSKEWLSKLSGNDLAY